MKMHWSPKSPFVRKVMIALHEIGLVDRVETIRSVALVTEPNAILQRDNPLSKIPTLILDDGQIIYDSAVICEYLDTLHSRPPKLCPESGAGRWAVLRRQALADGLLDLLLVWRHELLRPLDRRSQEHLRAYSNKVEAALNALEEESELLGGAINIANIAIGCTLSHADFRFADLEWRKNRPRLAAWHRDFEARPSAQATAIRDDA